MSEGLVIFLCLKIVSSFRFSSFFFFSSSPLPPPLPLYEEETKVEMISFVVVVD